MFWKTRLSFKKKTPRSDRTSRQPHPSSSMISYLGAWLTILTDPYLYFEKKVVFLAKLIPWVPGWGALHVCHFFFWSPPFSFTSPWAAGLSNLAHRRFFFFSLMCRKWGDAWEYLLLANLTFDASDSISSAQFYKTSSRLCGAGKNFQASFCINALRCEVSPLGCYICFSCHGAVCLPESLCCREQLAEQRQGGREDCRHPCFISPSHGLPHLLLVWLHNKVVQDLFTQQNLFFSFFL